MHKVVIIRGIILRRVAISFLNGGWESATPVLNWWATARIEEVNRTLVQLEIEASLHWELNQRCLADDYSAVLYAHFDNIVDAVTFKLAWEPDSKISDLIKEIP